MDDPPQSYKNPHLPDFIHLTASNALTNSGVLSMGCEI